MEDCVCIFSFYYLLLGVLASGVAAIYQFSEGAHAIPPFIIVTMLLVATMVSVTISITIIRLRQAYREGVVCMNVIKEFYIEQFKQQMPAIEHAFRWRLRTIPLGERIGSVTFMFGYLNALIGSLCLAGAVFISTEQPFSQPGSSILAGLPFVIALLLHIPYYPRALSKRSRAEVIREESVQIGVALR